MKFADEYYQNHERRGCIFAFITAIARVSGLITLAALGFVTYLEWLKESSLNFRIYITIVTIIVGYLELLWIFDKCISCCICCFRSETCFYWICCIPIDNWLKTIIYLGLSIPFLLPTWVLSVISMDIRCAGILMIISGIFYFLKTFKYKHRNLDNFQEDDNLFKSSPRPSMSTQTSTMGINNDNLTFDFK